MSLPAKQTEMRSGDRLWRPDISDFPGVRSDLLKVSQAFSWVDPEVGLPHTFYSLLSVPSEAAL